MYKIYSIIFVIVIGIVTATPSYFSSGTGYRILSRGGYGGSYGTSSGSGYTSFGSAYGSSGLGYSSLRSGYGSPGSGYSSLGSGYTSFGSGYDPSGSRYISSSYRPYSRPVARNVVSRTYSNGGGYLGY